jgi:hypothetical protein
MFDASSNPLDRTCPIVQCEGKKEEEMESEDEMDETAIPYATMSFLQTITTTTTTHPSWKLLFSHPPVEQPPQNHPEGKETSSSSSSVSFVEQKGTHHKEQPYDVSMKNLCVCVFVVYCLLGYPNDPLCFLLIVTNYIFLFQLELIHFWDNSFVEKAGFGACHQGWTSLHGRRVLCGGWGSLRRGV